jgi:hypothetical protein
MRAGEAIGSFERQRTAHPMTQSYISEDINPHRRCENLNYRNTKKNWFPQKAMIFCLAQWLLVFQKGICSVESKHQGNVEKCLIKTYIQIYESTWSTVSRTTKWPEHTGRMERRQNLRISGRNPWRAEAFKGQENHGLFYLRHGKHLHSYHTTATATASTDEQTVKLYMHNA